MISNYLKNIGLKSKIAVKNLVKIDAKKRNKILETYSRELFKNKKKIIRENTKMLRLVKEAI